MSQDIATIKDQLAQLKALHDSGALSTEHFEASKVRLERLLVDKVMASGASASAAPVALTTTAAANPAAAAVAMATTAQAALPTPPAVATSRWLMPASAAFVLLVAAAGYAWKGSPSLINAKAPDVAAASGAAPHGTDQGGDANAPPIDAAQFEALVEKLRLRLENEPNNVEGWGMLARSYVVMGKSTEAVATYKKAVALKPDDATLLADYADALAVSQGRSLAGEPGKIVERALKLNPDEPKALSLAGTIAFDRKDYAEAVKLWERILAKQPDHPFAPQLRESIAEARQLGGMPALPLGGAASALPSSAVVAAAAAQGAKPEAAAAATAEDASGKTAAPGSAQVTGRATLAPALAAKASPTDTVFVFARAAEGPRMPLAIMRKQVKDMPFDFKLDDSTAMAPTMKLSSFAQVVVGVRVSKSGDAMPQAGDLQGLSKPVAVGTTGLAIVVNEVIGQ